MSYIELINQFWRLSRASSFAPNETALYFALLDTCNTLGWKNPFNQSNRNLAAQCNVSEPTLIRARNYLKQAGLIDFKSDAGRRNNTVYEIKYLKSFSISDSISVSISDSISDSISVSISDEKPLDNIRQDRQEEKRREGESPARAIFLPVDDLLREALGNQIWIESACMSYRLKPDGVRQYLKQFAAEVKLKGEQVKSKPDFYSHFVNWLKIQIEKQSKNGNQAQSTSQQQAAVIARGSRL